MISLGFYGSSSSILVIAELFRDRPIGEPTIFFVRRSFDGLLGFELMNDGAVVAFVIV